MIPKIDLHVHLEGTITPSMVRNLAKRNKMTVPQDIFGPNETFIWKDFFDFQSVYDKASNVIRSAEDYYDVTYDYLARIAAEGCIYTELMDSPDHAALCGISYKDNIEGVTRAIDQARKDFGIEARIIIACVRHFGVDKCIKVAEVAAANPHPYIVGFGMGGDEKHYPPGQFAKAFQIAHEAGLKCTVHAGEVVGPSSVWEAINHLPVVRIGHGVRSIEDPTLVEELVDRDIALEVCPGSNIRLRVYPNFQSHPLLALREAGVLIAIGADDPPHFGTTIGQEYENLKFYFGLKDDEVLDITRNAIQVSFADDATKKKLLTTLAHAQ